MCLSRVGDGGKASVVVGVGDFVGGAESVLSNAGSACT